jgi:DNA-binding winged helix-turn-helix (wHTH) protein
MEYHEPLIPILIIYKGVLAGNRWPLQTSAVTIGRSSDCDIVLPERQISRFHIRIENSKNGYLLRDLGSKNGTHVNGEVVKSEIPYQLQDGDEIILANVVHFGFIAGEATLPLVSTTFTAGEVEIDSAQKSVRIGGVVLDPPLSPAQFTLLTLLMEADGRIVSREAVIAAIWPDAEGGVTDQAVDALIYRLRERLAEINSSANFVVTVRGHGFRFA